MTNLAFVLRHHVNRYHRDMDKLGVCWQCGAHKRDFAWALVLGFCCGAAVATAVFS